MVDLLILSDLRALTPVQSEEFPSHALILYDPKEHESAEALTEFPFDRFGTRLYVPPRFAQAAPSARVWMDGTIFGAPLARRLRAHRAQWGERAAAVLSPLGQAVTLSAAAPRFSALPDHLPGQAVFAGGDCAYQVVRQNDGWTFRLFDTEQTLRQRCALCEQCGVSYLVIERGSA
jgi:hypothetical protein